MLIFQHHILEDNRVVSKPRESKNLINTVRLTKPGSLECTWIKEHLSF